MSIPLKIISVLAWRNLWRNYRRTSIMLLAIVVGVWAMIFMNALMIGMVDGMVKGGIRNLPGHAQIHHPAYRDDPSVVNNMPAPAGDLLKALGSDGVLGWSARVRVPAVISSERDSRGVILLGVDPVREAGVGFDLSDLVDGRFLEAADDTGLVVGAKLLQRLETRLGKRVVVMSQDPHNNVAERGFRIVGVYSAELDSQEETFIYAGRETVQKMLEMGSAISEVAILGQDYRDLSVWYPALEQAAGSGLEVRDWRELDAFLDTMLGVQDGMALVLIVIIFIALSFGLVNTMVMAVFERIREIGLMQALGMRPSSILYQVLVEAFILLVLGLVLGNLLALLTIAPLESGIDISGIADGAEMFGMSTVLYPALRAGDMVMASVIVMVLGLLSSFLPAWRAAHINPVEAINKI
ncbi:MAG: FtsX-like permease family protein [Gammaproteobacteria bacterium]|nr:FtsX-like permease family protein [Gammaproteobacteria bacterium]